MAFETENTAAMGIHPLETLDLDFDAITAKYQEEKAKRMRKDGVKQFKEVVGEYAQFNDDIWAKPLTRDSTFTQTKLLIVGGGFAGLTTAVNLKKVGVEDFLILEKGGGFGGTWYWNQYPGTHHPQSKLSLADVA